MENQNKKWTEEPLSRVSLAANLLLALGLGTALSFYILDKSNSGAVSVAGKKYDLSDVKKSSPILYSKFQTEYTNLLKNTLGEFAQEKLFEIVAQEKNTKPSEVLKEGFVPTEPSDTEIATIYNTYKSQFNGQPLPQVKDQIANLLKNQQEEQHMQRLYKEILAKYPVEFLLKEPEEMRIPVEKKNNPSLGKDSAKITVIEFADFECPYCRRSQEVNRRLREKYKEEIEWVVRDFPLPFHENAMYAHIAANCSIPQGKYWQVFDTFFENSGNLSQANVDYLVTKVGVNKEQYQECMKDRSKLQKEVQEDIDDGQKVGVNGTPAFFINGIFVSGALPFERFDEIIQKELNK